MLLTLKGKMWLLGEMDFQPVEEVAFAYVYEQCFKIDYLSSSIISLI